MGTESEYGGSKGTKGRRDDGNMFIIGELLFNPFREIIFGLDIESSELERITSLCAMIISARSENSCSFRSV